MSVKIFVTKRGKDEQQYLIDLKRSQKSFEREFFALGDDTQKIMKDNIDSSTHREHTGKLSDNITVDKESFVRLFYMWGVGNINLLNSNTPYWDYADKGGIIPPITKGYFGDGESPDSSLKGRGTQLFTHDRNGFLVRPSTPTRPLNYIDKTIFWLDLNIRRLDKFFKGV